MKNIIITLILIALLAGCKQRGGQTTKKQAETANSALVVEQEKNNTIAKVETTEKQFPLIGNTIGFISFDFDRWYEDEQHNPSPNMDSMTDMEILNKAGILEYTDGGKVNIDTDDFMPWAFEPGIGVFIIRCIAKSENDYFIVINEDENLVKQVKKHEYLKFQSIEEHVASRIVDTDFDLNPIREYPDDNAQKIDITNLDLELTASVERKGDWIKIEDSYKSKVLGWIRWKKDDRFMVWLYYSV